MTLTKVLGAHSVVVGVEPNQYALKLARAASVEIGVFPGNALDLPFKNSYFDLVFTANVLIHIRLQDLVTALIEIHRVSNRYILAIEYFAEEETTITYRGHAGLLWKRDFLKHYQDQFPGLTLIRSGRLGPKNGFDRSRWWLLEKI